MKKSQAFLLTATMFVCGFLLVLLQPKWIVSAGQGTTTVVGGVGGNPGGANTQVQFNSGSTFGGSPNLTFNSGTATLTIGQSGVAGTLAVGTGGSGTVSFSSPSNNVVFVGTGSAGTVRDAALVTVGTTFTASGCGNTTLTGGSTAGSYVSVTAGACTITITMGNSVAAVNGWVCDAHDITTAADANNVTQGSLVSTSQATLVEGTVAANDVIVFKCVGY